MTTMLCGRPQRGRPAGSWLARAGLCLRLLGAVVLLLACSHGRSSSASASDAGGDGVDGTGGDLGGTNNTGAGGDGAAGGGNQGGAGGASSPGSPHTYGPAVHAQPHFFSGGCAGLEGDEAAAADCTFDLDSARMRAGWEEHFGFLRDMGFAVIIGEFGGNMDWPHQGTRQAERDMWSHIADNPDQRWQDHFVDYLIDEDIQGCYWSINPESADTGGIYRHSWDPVSNAGGWGQWDGMDPRKVELLRRLWGT